MSPALRKAAILITALDTPAADALLAQMDAKQAQIVRSAVLSLGEVSPEEQQQVLEDFFRQQGRSGASEAAAGVTLELSAAADPPAMRPSAAASDPPSAAQSSEGASPAAGHAEASNAWEEPPLAFLHAVEPTALADVLKKEHPQTAAVVLAHLPPEQAAAVLQQLPPALATEALTRMASLAPLAREVLLDLAQVLQRLLAPHLTSAAALEKLSAVLGAMDEASRQQVLAQLSRQHAFLARRLWATWSSAPASREERAGMAERTEPVVTAFRYRLRQPDRSADASRPAQTGLTWTQTDTPGELPAETAEDRDHLHALAVLEDASLTEVLTRLDVPTLALALLGADAPLVARVLRLLPPQASRWLRTALAQPRPIRLRDLEQAQQRCLAAIHAVSTEKHPLRDVVSPGAHLHGASPKPM